MANYYHESLYSKSELKKIAYNKNLTNNICTLLYIFNRFLQYMKICYSEVIVKAVNYDWSKTRKNKG